MRSTKEILEEVDSVELNTLSLSQIKAYVRRLKKTASTRLTALRKRGVEPNNIEEAFRRIHKNDDINVMRRQFVYLTKFLNRQTSTIRGYNKWIKNVEQTLGVTFTKNQMKRFWKLKDKIEELGVYNALGSKEAIATMAEVFKKHKKLSNGKLLDLLEKELITEYELKQESMDDSLEDLRNGGGNKFSY